MSPTGTTDCGERGIMTLRDSSRNNCAGPEGRQDLRFACSLLLCVLASAVSHGISGTPPNKVADPETSACPEIKPGKAPIFIRQELERRLSLFGSVGEETDSWVSTYCLDFAQDNACLFFSIMRQHADLFERWLKDLGKNSFEDHGGCTDLECRRQRTINSLRTIAFYELTNKPELRAMLERLIGRLTEIKVIRNPY
jgi:hypothetical protein